MKVNNLRSMKIKKNNIEFEEQKNYNIKSSKIECYFMDIEKHLCDKIKTADAVVGCVAWLTNDKILDRLAKLKYGASIIV